MFDLDRAEFLEDGFAAMRLKYVGPQYRLDVVVRLSRKDFVHLH